MLTAHAGAERSDAVLTHKAEESLKAAIYDGTFSGSCQGGPAQALLGFLEQPFTDLRVAAYRYAVHISATTAAANSK